MEAHQSSSFRSWPDVNAPPYRTTRQAGWSHERADLAEGVFQTVIRMRPNFTMPTVQKITGMLMQLDFSALELMVHNEALMNARIDDAVQAWYTFSHPVDRATESVRLSGEYSVGFAKDRD